MKNTKKLFLSVFALSAMILSACSGGTVTPDTSSTEPAPGTSSTEPAPVPASSSSLAPEESSSLNPEESSSGSEESSSGGGEESSSSEQVEFKADYQIEIGNAKYDLILNEGQTLHTKEYYFGANVSKTVAAGEIITFKKYQNNEYQSFAVAPSPDDEPGFTYNNVVKDGNDYKIRASGSVGVYLKLDGTDWSYWISGGGDIPRAEPGYYLRGNNIGSNWSIDPDYKLAQGTGEDSSKYYINYDAVQGDEFKICQVSEDGTETWWPYNAGTDSEPDYKGYYKNSEEAKSAIYKGYLYGDKDYNLQTIIPGNYRIEIDTTDNGIWSSINVNQDSEELLNPLQYGPVDGGMAFDLDFGYLIGGGYKYYASDLDLSEAPEDLSMAFKWKDGSKVIFELDEDKTAEQYFTVDFDNATLTVKEGAEDKVDLTFALQCGKMILSVTETPVLCNVTFRVKLSSEVEDLRVLGSFNNWKDPNDEYVLNELDPNEHIYVGQFSIPSGSIKFKFMYGENTWEDTITDRELTIEGNAITPIYVFDKNEVVKEYTMVHVDTSGVAQVPMKAKDANEYTLLGYSLEVGDLIYFNMDGTIKDYSDLKLSEYAQSHFKENTENGYIEVTQAGEFDIYVKVTPESEGEYEGKSIWIGEYTPVVAKEYVFKANDEVIPNTKNIVEQDDEQNNGKYVITFADSDIGKVITIFDEETQLQFGDNSSVKTFTIAKAGEHTFYINNKNPQEVWVTEPKNPEDLLTIKCYLKKEGENVSWWTSNNAVTYAQVWDVVDEVAKNIQFLEVKSITLKGGDVNDNYYEIEIDLGAARPQKILLLRCDPTVVTQTPTSWPSSGVWNQTLDADIDYDWDTPGCDLLIKESESALPERYVAVAKNGDWNKMQYVELVADQLVFGNYVARNVSLEEGDVFYLLAAPKDTTNPDGIWKHYDNIAEEGAYANFEDNKDDDHNFKVKEGKSGVYNIFVKATVDGIVTIKERVADELYIKAEYEYEDVLHEDVATLDASLVDNKPTYIIEGTFGSGMNLSVYFIEGQLLTPQATTGADLIEEVSGQQGVFRVKAQGTYQFTFTYDNNVMSVSIEESTYVPDEVIWLGNGGSWRAIGLSENPEHAGELMATNVTLQEGDEFVIHLTGDNYIKTITGGGAASNFEINENGNIALKAGKDGAYNFYIYENLTKVNVEEYAEIPDTVYSTYSISLGGFAKKDHNLKIHSWGGAHGVADYDLANDATTFKVEEGSSFIIVRLKAGESEYGKDWANKDVQTPTYVAVENGDAILTYTSGEDFEWRVSGNKLTGSVEFEIEWARPDYIVEQNGGVFVSGTFNNWAQNEADINPYKMTYDEATQTWSVTIDNVPLGEKVEFKFVIFGTNPSNEFWKNWKDLNNPDTDNPDGQNYIAYYTE
ncbi:MAG: hypothetical protein E7178_03000 [Erysipelotrichaceae bacterium]|jgi:hypothetical protein|nr:hypothetical protein [Erysipelotrichaceae bacterium]